MTETDPYYLKKIHQAGFRAGFVERVADLNFTHDRDAALAALLPYHHQAVLDLGFSLENLCTAEQVHGAELAVVDAGGHSFGVDGLVTNVEGLALSIYVADCGAVYIVDPVQNALGLVHSGKKGSQMGIVENAITLMQSEYGSRPEDMIVSLAPCIRPPAYEVDFAAQIRSSVAKLGVRFFVDSETCTSSDLSKYYSYRLEHGATGRMVAILGR